MKVIVYTICRNESAFVNRWVDSMSEADEIYVLDTGSSDDTVKILRARGVHVKTEIIIPWRFDVARNRSLNMVAEDADICVCTDLDEVFYKGWRNALELAWESDSVQARCRYTWSFNPDGSEGVVFWSEKIHARHGFEWINPVHEVLRRTCVETISGKTVDAHGVQLNHYPDPTKSRGQYLPLLELAVQERPDDDRNIHYLGREYMYYRKWDECIRTLKHHLSLPNAIWRDERAASMRYIARAHAALGEYSEALNWHLKSIVEAPHLREPYVETAQFLYEQSDWDGVLYFTSCAIKITSRPDSYICEAEAWGSLPYDLRAIALFNTGRIEHALTCAHVALAYEPQSPRLAENVRLITQTLSDSHQQI